MILLILFLVGFILAIVGLFPTAARYPLFDIGILLAVLALGLRVFFGVSA